MVVSEKLFCGLSIESIDIVVVKFPDNDGFVSGSRNEDVGVLSFFGGVSGLEGSDPSVVSGEDTHVLEFASSGNLFHF